MANDAQATRQQAGGPGPVTKERGLEPSGGSGGSPPGWPQQCSNARTGGGAPDWPPISVWPAGRPIAQWPRLEAGRSDDLGSN